MKKGFISILALLALLALSLAITFIYQQNLNTSQYSKDLYNKKKAQYLAESVLNVYIEENSKEITDFIIDDYKENKNISNRETVALRENLNIDYEDNKYYLKLAYINRNDNFPTINNLYMLSSKNIQIGQSKAIGEIYFKVLENSEKEDDYKIEIAFRRTY